MTAAQARSTAFRLIGEVGGENLHIVLERGNHTIGCHPDNTVCIAQPQISRRHAEIVVNGKDALLSDLNSKNGTFVNGVKVRRKTLKHNDWIQVGSVVLTFEEIPEDEHDLAISTEEGPSDGRQVSPTDDEPDSTELGLLVGRTADWAQALSRCSEVLLGHQNPDVQRAVQELADLEAGLTVLLVHWDEKALPTVAAVAGDAEVVGAMVDLSCIAESHPGSGTDAVVSCVNLALNRPATAAVRWTSRGWSSALVAYGVTLSSVCKPVLETALRLLESSASVPKPSPSRTAETAHSLAFPEHHVVSRSQVMRRLYDQLQSFARGDMPILVTGETGVGKEHILRILHDSSARSAGPLQIVNCTAIPKDLLEAELFGIEGGVATGVTRRDGKMRLADRGTLVLDEIGDMDRELQAKLLRALQEGEVYPVGAPKPIPVDVRFVAVTHADLAERVRAGTFREDLFYRIAGCELHVPSLRERRDDVPALVRHFLERALDQTGKSIRGVSVKTMSTLVEAPWPGNVRQLQREIERLVALCPEGQTIESSMISAAVVNIDLNGAASDHDLNIKRQLALVERRLILKALERAQCNHSEAARLLGISRNGLTMKMERLGIEGERRS